MPLFLLYFFFGSYELFLRAPLADEFGEAVDLLHPGARRRQNLDTMTLFPRKARAQFEYVLGWLRDWACAREQGL